MYYVISEADDSILNRYHSEPTQERLQKDADNYGVPVYVIQGENIGMTATPSDDEDWDPEAEEALDDGPGPGIWAGNEFFGEGSPGYEHMADLAMFGPERDYPEDRMGDNEPPF